MAANPTEVIKDIESGKISPVYFLHGEESYYIDKVASSIENKLIPEDQREFNQVIMYGKDYKVNEILTNARRFPMMAERQVVIVKEAQEVFDLTKDPGEKLLIDYLKNPVPSTVLVFCHKHKKVDGRSALSKALNKHAILITTRQVYENQIPQWIENYFRGKNRKATPKAIQMLTGNIGNNLERLSNEIDKMLLNLDEDQEVDDRSVEKYVGINRDYNAFEFQNALVYRDYYKANRIINYFDGNWKRTPIFMIIGILFAFFSKVLIVHNSRDRSNKALASRLATSPYFIKDYTRAAQNYSLIKVLENIHFIKEADLQVKGITTSNLPEGQILRELTFKLIHE